MYYNGGSRRRRHKSRKTRPPRPPPHYTKINPQCDAEMSFEECELAVLRHAVDTTEKIQKKQLSTNEEIKKIIAIVEEFLKTKDTICYGGTAINNILPPQAQFYDKDIDIPDYDFFTPDALDYAKELADIYADAGYEEVEAKAGMHFGTFKVFVNFIPIADITYIHPDLYKNLKKDTIVIDGIHYAPPNFLRMSMYYELSLPEGDVSRWEKVLKRLVVLNKYYPLDTPFSCEEVDFQRNLEAGYLNEELLYVVVRDAFIEKGVVFIGGYSSSLYARYSSEHDNRKIMENIPDFDVIAENPEETAHFLETRLKEAKFNNVHLVRHSSVGEILPSYIEVLVDKETVAFIFKPVACHNYNEIELDRGAGIGEGGRGSGANGGKITVKVGTIDTILSFYLLFLYIDTFLYYRERLLCMAHFLFKIQQRNRLNQKGLLKRFTVSCYGKQSTLNTVREKKTIMFSRLNKDKTTREYEMWFLKYNPISKRARKPTVVATSTPSIITETKTLSPLSVAVPPTRQTPTRPTPISITPTQTPTSITPTQTPTSITPTQTPISITPTQTPSTQTLQQTKYKPKPHKRQTKKKRNPFLRFLEQKRKQKSRRKNKNDYI